MRLSKVLFVCLLIFVSLCAHFSLYGFETRLMIMSDIIASVFMDPEDKNISSRIRPTANVSSFISMKDISSGRLGNKMYVYATAMALSTRFNMPLSLPEEVISVLDKMFEGIQAIPNPETDWEDFRFEDIASFKSAPSNRSIRVSGCPIDAQFFNSIRDEIVHHHFVFRSKYLVSDQNILHKAKEINSIKENSDFMYVGIHIRRTDYNYHIKLLTSGGHLPERDYVMNAMKFLKCNPGKYKRVIYVVVSDDKKWVEDNILFPPNVIWGGMNMDDPGYDMALMTQCNHTILTVGTFGFWAAYLGRRGYVIMPADYSNSTIPYDEYENVRQTNLIDNKWIFL